MTRSDGTVVARSVLDDSQIDAETQSKSFAEQKQLKFVADSSSEDAAKKLPKRIKLVKQQESLLATSSDVLKDLANYPEQYIANLRTLQETMISIRNHCLERSTSLVKFLPIYEQTSLNKEAAILENWQERQREWGRIQTHISRKIGTPKVNEFY